MGTRSITAFYQDDKLIGSFYKQHDGYPSDLGKELIELLNKGNVRMTNGFSFTDKHPEVFNGIGDLAAYLIKNLKEGIGGMYLDGDDPKTDPQQYNYLFSGQRDSPVLNIEVRSCREVLYSGPIGSCPDMGTLENKDDEE